MARSTLTFSIHVVSTSAYAFSIDEISDYTIGKSRSPAPKAYENIPIEQTL